MCSLCVRNVRREHIAAHLVIDFSCSLGLAQCITQAVWALELTPRWRLKERTQTHSSSYWRQCSAVSSKGREDRVSKGPTLFLTSRSTTEVCILTPTTDDGFNFSHIRVDRSLIYTIGAIYCRPCLLGGVYITRLLRTCLPAGICMPRVLHSNP